MGHGNGISVRKMQLRISKGRVRMNDDVIQIIHKQYWSPRRKLMLKLAVFYFCFGFAVATVIFWG